MTSEQFYRARLSLGCTGRGRVDTTTGQIAHGPSNGACLDLYRYQMAWATHVDRYPRGKAPAHLAPKPPRSLWHLFRNQPKPPPATTPLTVTGESDPNAAIDAEYPDRSAWQKAMDFGPQIQIGKTKIPAWVVFAGALAATKLA
jgi:hypothetical protein